VLLYELEYCLRFTRFTLADVVRFAFAVAKAAPAPEFWKDSLPRRVSGVETCTVDQEDIMKVWLVVAAVA